MEGTRVRDGLLGKAKNGRDFIVLNKFIFQQLIAKQI